jgi:hypothetical protein
MKRGKNIKSSIPGSCVDFTAAVIGAGAAAPALPANGNFTPTTTTYPLRANATSKLAAEVPVRSGVGVYVITIEHPLPNILFASAVVVKAGAAPTAELAADVTIIDTANRQITVKVITPAGLAADCGVNDMLLLYVHGQDSGA